jgi:PGF-CTERM protein
MTRSPPPDGSDRTRSTELNLPGKRRLAAVALAALLVASAAVVPGAAQSDGDTFTLETDSITSAAETTVNGTTTLDSGTELRVRMQSTGGTEPAFLKSKTVTVGPEGAWNATFNLSAVETHDGASVTMSAVDGDTSETFEVSLRDDEVRDASEEAPISTPGFGVAVAVVALLGSAAVFASRRR